MGFFDKVGSTISKTGKDAAAKVKEMAEIAKLNGQITTQEDIVKKNYLEIGKYVYENQKDGAPNEVAEKFAVIDAANEEIAKLKQQINDINGVKYCPQCNGEVAKGVAFCPSCGFKMPEEAPEVVEEGEVKEVVEEAAETAAEAVEDASETIADVVNHEV